MSCVPHKQNSLYPLSPEIKRKKNYERKRQQEEEEENQKPLEKIGIK